MISDSTPDGWMMIVMTRHARHSGMTMNLSDLSPVDFPPSVADAHRIGALRNIDEDGAIAPGNAGPAVASTREAHLAELIAASAAIERGAETASDLQLLAMVGTSLGGLRPKPSVSDADGTLWIAKFPSAKDTVSITRGEALAPEIARQAGLRVPLSSIIDLRGVPVLLVKRFDRTREGGRRHYASGFTALDADRQIEGSYVGMAERLRLIAKEPGPELRALFQRMVLKVLINNTDVYLGNHAFLYTGGFWSLSPIFDINPFPETMPVLKTAISTRGGPEASLRACISEAASFGLSDADAAEAVAQVHAVALRWRDIRTSPEVGMTEREADLFTPAFRAAGISAPARGRSLVGEGVKAPPARRPE
jgi:serine/threonine-protein kinase HipA